MKALVLIGWVCLAVHAWAATVVAPNGLETKEGSTLVIPLFGGDQVRTQVIYGSQHFSLFPPEGAYITEIRFRMDGQYLTGFSGSADMEVHLSTSSQNPNKLASNMESNIGLDETIVLPRSTVSLSSPNAVPGGPNSFSVVNPLPTQFYYNPARGNLLMDARVYGFSNINNLDWDSSPTDGVSAALAVVTSSTAGIITSTAPVTQFVFVPVPEPSTVASLIFGIFIVAGVWRRKVAAI
jgi:hypothetical protein